MSYSNVKTKDKEGNLECSQWKIDTLHTEVQRCDLQYNSLQKPCKIGDDECLGDFCITVAGRIAEPTEGRRGMFWETTSVHLESTQSP